MIRSYTAVRGTQDFNPSQTQIFNYIIQNAKKIFILFNYQEIILPILEKEFLFVRSVGEATDIMEKQIFRIENKNYVLRPEGTAQVVRYFLERALYKYGDFYKFFYIGAMFRGERPQKGRLRQFHHIGAEAIGSNSIYIDLEIIDLVLNILKEIGILGIELKINTLGCSLDKESFSSYLREKLFSIKEELCEFCKRRLEINPLRILDCKEENCKKIISNLKLENKYLCQKCQLDFEKLLSLLDKFGIKYTYSPYLVRGLDYYTNTVFELVSNKLGSQDAIGAGGRYNDLIKNLGGPNIPAVGFALGIERIMLLLNEIPKEKNILFLATTSNTLLEDGLKIVKEIRKENIPIEFDYCNRSLKSQLRYAQKIGAKLVLILGDKEYSEGFIILRDMENSTQEKVNLKNIIPILKNFKL